MSKAANALTFWGLAADWEPSDADTAVLLVTVALLKRSAVLTDVLAVLVELANELLSLAALADALFTTVDASLAEAVFERTTLCESVLLVWSVLVVTFTEVSVGTVSADAVPAAPKKKMVPMSTETVPTFKRRSENRCFPSAIFNSCNLLLFLEYIILPPIYQWILHYFDFDAILKYLFVTYQPNKDLKIFLKRR